MFHEAIFMGDVLGEASDGPQGGRAGGPLTRRRLRRFADRHGLNTYAHHFGEQGDAAGHLQLPKHTVTLAKAGGNV